MFLVVLFLQLFLRALLLKKTGAKGENKINAYGFICVFFFSGKCDSCVYFVEKSEQLNCFLLSPFITERTFVFLLPFISCCYLSKEVVILCSHT